MRDRRVDGVAVSPAPRQAVRATARRQRAYGRGVHGGKLLALVRRALGVAEPIARFSVLEARKAVQRDLLALLEHRVEAEQRHLLQENNNARGDEWGRAWPPPVVSPIPAEFIIPASPAAGQHERRRTRSASVMPSTSVGLSVPSTGRTARYRRVVACRSRMGCSHSTTSPVASTAWPPSCSTCRRGRASPELQALRRSACDGRAHVRFGWTNHVRAKR